MRPYAVILIALVVFVGGLVARRYLAPAAGGGAVSAEVEAGTRALNAADALASALAAGQRGVAEIDPKVRSMRESCESLERMRPTPACGALRGKGDALQRAARDGTIGEGEAAEFQGAAAKLRGELGRGGS